MPQYLVANYLPDDFDRPAGEMSEIMKASEQRR